MFHHLISPRARRIAELLVTLFQGLREPAYYFESKLLYCYSCIGEENTDLHIYSAGVERG